MVESASPLAVFQLFLHRIFWNIIIAEQTYQYAPERMVAEAFLSLVLVSVVEFKTFMGFMILMGITRLPLLCDYWKKDPVYHYSPAASRMSKKRFLEINRCLYFADNSALAPSGCRGYKKTGKGGTRYRKDGE